MHLKALSPFVNFVFIIGQFNSKQLHSEGHLQGTRMAKVNLASLCWWVFAFAVIQHMYEFRCGGSTVAPEKNHHVIQMESLVPASTCSASSARGTKMRVVYRHGPCSPLKMENPKSPSSTEILQQDVLRVKILNSKTTSFRRRLGGDVRGSRLLTYGGPIGAGNLVVSVGFGTPTQYFTMIFDTGSKYTWIQCAPCSNTTCYPQQDPLYDASKSITHSNASCEHSSTCDYYIEYGDMSSSTGHLVRDTLTLTSSDTFANFVFGCGQMNQGIFGKAAGVLGFGSDIDTLSLLSQTAGNTGYIFCYCLPVTDSSNGHITFGSEALATCSSDIYTSIIKYQDSPSFYYIVLYGITIGGTQLGISPFRTIIDSGTVITRLPPSVYTPLRSAFMQSMSAYPVAPPLSSLMDTCYNLTMYDNFTAPEMVLQLERSREVRLHPSAVVWRENNSQVCLAFAGNERDSDKVIIGNHQQRSLNILYDIRAKELAFASHGC